MPSLFGRLLPRVKASRRCERGSVLPLVAICAFVLLATTGLAVDGARLMLMQSALQSATDAGGLSAVAKVSTTEVQKEVQKFADANFASGYVGARITALSATLSADEKTLTVTASAEAPTSFMKLFGVDKIRTVARSEVTRAMGGLELALVLDVTGSMNTGGKLASLKVAAKDLLDIVFGADATADGLYVGVVPFSQAVNVAPTRTSWLTATVPNWKGCVEERFNGLDQTDDPPSVQKFPASSNAVCPPSITPLTSTKATAVAAINNLVAEGSTHIAGGAVWGWRLLSPRWRGLWGGTMGTKLPLDYRTAGMNKAIVLMTDGENQFASGGSYGAVKCTKYIFIFCSQYGTDERLNLTGSSNQAVQALADAALDARLSAVCTAMKNAGATVYTVAFGSPGTAIENRLRECASQNAFFFSSPTGAALRVAFAKIGDSLSNLRVSR